MATCGELHNAFRCARGKLWNLRTRVSSYLDGGTSGETAKRVCAHFQDVLYRTLPYTSSNFSSYQHHRFHLCRRRRHPRRRPPSACACALHPLSPPSHHDALPCVQYTGGARCARWTSTCRRMQAAKRKAGCAHGRRDARVGAWRNGARGWRNCSLVA